LIHKVNGRFEKVKLFPTGRSLWTSAGKHTVNKINTIRLQILNRATRREEDLMRQIRTLEISSEESNTSTN
jgi:hypothetical protein